MISRNKKKIPPFHPLHSWDHHLKLTAKAPENGWDPWKKFGDSPNLEETPPFLGAKVMLVFSLCTSKFVYIFVGVDPEKHPQHPPTQNSKKENLNVQRHESAISPKPPLCTWSVSNHGGARTLKKQRKGGHITYIL